MRRMLLLASMATFIFAFSANAQNKVNALSLKKQVKMENFEKKCPFQIKTAQVTDFSLLVKGKRTNQNLISTRAEQEYKAIYHRPEGSFHAGVENDGTGYLPLFIAPETTLDFYPGSTAGGKGTFSWTALTEQGEVDLSDLADEDFVLHLAGEAGQQYYMPILTGEYQGESYSYRYGGDVDGYVCFGIDKAFPLTYADINGDIFGTIDQARTKGFFPSYKVNGVPCAGFMSAFEPQKAALDIDHISLMAFKYEENGGAIIPEGTTMTVDLALITDKGFEAAFATATATPADCKEVMDGGKNTGVFIINFYFPNKQSIKVDANAAFGALVNVTDANNILLPFTTDDFGMGSAYTLHGNKFNYFLEEEKANLCHLFIQLHGIFETGPASIATTKSEGNINAISSNNAFIVSYPEGLTSVEVLNVAGQKVANYNLEGTSATISAAGLANGLYLLKFNNGSTIKVMK